MKQIFKLKGITSQDKQYNNGWDDGFRKGANAALKESTKVYTKLINKEIGTIHSAEEAEGLKKAIKIIEEYNGRITTNRG